MIEDDYIQFQPLDFNTDELVTNERLSYGYFSDYDIYRSSIPLSALPNAIC
jgi:hypothetical protein